MDLPVLTPIGIVHSPLKTLGDCPLQGHEGAPEAELEIFSNFREGTETISKGSQLLLLTWLHGADRGVLKCYPRNETTAPPIGVFSTRSPDRPNPIGLHPVTVTEVLGSGRIKVSPLEALDGTPLIDIKPQIRP